MFGIGITTYKRPKHLDFCLKQILEYTGVNYKLHIADDSNERMGIAYRKNECLKELQDCKYVFLFDDDCFPVWWGWEMFFVNASIRTGQHHFLYLRDIGQTTRTETIENIDIFDESSGCMIFLDQEVIQKVGGFNPAYSIYGFEHAGYSQRIHRAGLTPMGPYLCPSGSHTYIHSLDLDGPYKDLKPEPSLANDFDRLKTYIAINKQVYDNDLQIYHKL